MQDRKVNLYSIKKDNGDWFLLRAYTHNGCLTLEGQDFSQPAKAIFGDEEYEYYYSFDLENTRKLMKVLKNDDILNALIHFFNNKMKNEEFIKLCNEGGVFFKTHVV